MVIDDVILEKHRPYLLTVAKSMGVPASEVEDIVQATFISCDGRDVDEPRTFLCFAVRNKCRSWHSNNKKDRDRKEHYVRMRARQISDPGFDRIDNADLIEKYKSCPRLSPRERSVVNLYLLDFSTIEIAQEMNISENLVRKTKSRAVKKMQDYFTCGDDVDTY